MSKLTIIANEQVAYEYDDAGNLEEGQLAFLDKIDHDMDRGIKIKGELITCPDNKQRAMFVAMNLIRALQQDNQAIITASCAYLVNRNPGLTEIHVNDHEVGINIEFYSADVKMD